MLRDALAGSGAKLHLIKICLAAFWFIYCWLDQISLIKLRLQFEEPSNSETKHLIRACEACLLSKVNHAACKLVIETKYQQSSTIPTQPEQTMELSRDLGLQ